MKVNLIQRSGHGRLPWTWEDLFSLLYKVPSHASNVLPAPGSAPRGPFIPSSPVCVEELLSIEKSQLLKEKKRGSSKRRACRGEMWRPSEVVQLSFWLLPCGNPTLGCCLNINSRPLQETTSLHARRPTFLALSWPISSQQQC